MKSRQQSLLFLLALALIAFVFAPSSRIDASHDGAVADAFGIERTEVLRLTDGRNLAAASAGVYRQDDLDAAITVCEEGCDHTTIASALDASETGDSIFVGNGTYTESITITKSVNLFGVDTSSTILDGENSHRPLYVYPGVGATVSNFSIRNGRGASGAGVYNRGSLFLINCLVEDNHTTDAASGYGGGIFNYGGTMTLSGVVARGNSAEIGGGILNSYGGMSISRSEVSDNVAVQVGGGIFNGVTAYLTLDTVAIEGNVVGSDAVLGRGGGMYNTGFVFAERSTLAENRSNESGGAVYQYVDNTIISNSTLTGNHADFGGSAVYIGAGAMLITNSTFVQNTGGFGAIFSNDTINLRNSLIGVNSPSSCFGTITSGGYNLDSGNTCSFNEEGDQTNTDPKIRPLGFYGGALRTHSLESDSPAIDAGDPLGCTAPDDTLLVTDQRGQIRPVDGDLDGETICDIGSVEFQDESIVPTATPVPPETVPGAITVCESGCDHVAIQPAIDAAASGDTISIGEGIYTETLQVARSVTLAGPGANYAFVDADRSGPGITLSGDIDVELRGLTFFRGEGIVNDGSNLTVKRSTIKYNSSTEAGGIVSSGTLLVEDSEISSNVSLTRGGAIRVNGGSATVRRSRLLNNTSAVDGGAIFVDGTLLVEDSEVQGNGGRYGGGIASRQGDLQVERTSFVGNRAEFGGGVFVYGGQFGCETCSFSSNRGDVGAGIYLSAPEEEDAAFTLNDNTWTGNSAEEGAFAVGGGLAVNGVSLTLEGGTLSENRAASGGGIYLYRNTADVQLNGTTLSGNGAFWGGAVYVAEGVLRAPGARLVFNSAGFDGGGIHTAGGHAILDEVDLVNNSAGRFGGAIYVEGEGLGADVTNSEIVGNSAGRHGGGIQVGPRGLLAMSDVNLMNNAAEGFDAQGGGLQVDLEGEAELSRVLVAENESLLGGGVAVSGTLLADNTTIAGNIALGGGGVYVGGGEVELSSATVADNIVSAAEGETPGAGGVHVDAGRASLRGSIVARSGEVADCIGSVRSLGYNLDGDGSCGLDGNGDQSAEAPGLRELADYGGPTMTLALFPGSSAVDAGDPAGCDEAFDQRGRDRIVDGDGDGTARCDIGAFEFNPDDAPPGEAVYLPSLRKGD